MFSRHVNTCSKAMLNTCAFRHVACVLCMCPLHVSYASVLCMCPLYVSFASVLCKCPLYVSIACVHCMCPLHVSIVCVHCMCPLLLIKLSLPPPTPPLSLSSLSHVSTSHACITSPLVFFIFVLYQEVDLSAWRSDGEQACSQIYGTKETY